MVGPLVTSEFRAENGHNLTSPLVARQLHLLGQIVYVANETVFAGSRLALAVQALE
jgi:hypothetical protein